MKVNVVEISGYLPAFISLYMTNRSLTPEKLGQLNYIVDHAVNKRGFVDHTSAVLPDFYEELEKCIKYGIKAEHHTILKYIDVHIYTQGLHRGAQDDFDAHAARMNILRSTTRTMKGADHPEFSDYYKDKIITFEEALMKLDNGHAFPESFTDKNGQSFLKTPWGYVKAEHENNADARRGLTPLGMSSDNISKIAYGEHLQHIYDLRREEATGKKANPELRLMMEMMRDELNEKCPPLGEYLGKVWVSSGGGHYEEKVNTYRVSKFD